MKNKIHYRTIAVVTARGGSTRTPNKNGRDFCGLPLLAWSIVQAVNSEEIDAVFLTTDSEEYAEIGKKFGATVIMRPVYDNGITASVVFKHAIGVIENDLNIEFDNIVTMLPTSPLKMPGQIDAMVKDFIANGYDEVTTGAPIKETFVFKHKKGSYWDRFRTKNLGPSYQCRTVISDKFWKYSKLGGGWGIATRDRYMEICNSQPPTDLEIDVVASKHPDTKRIWNFFAIEDWQLFEVDYPQDFMLCEALMNTFILDGNGPEVYGNRIPEEYKIDRMMKKYSGNSNQF